MARTHQWILTLQESRSTKLDYAYCWMDLAYQGPWSFLSLKILIWDFPLKVSHPYTSWLFSPRSLRFYINLSSVLTSYDRWSPHIYNYNHPSNKNLIMFFNKMRMVAMYNNSDILEQFWKFSYWYNRRNRGFQSLWLLRIILRIIFGNQRAEFNFLQIQKWKFFISQDYFSTFHNALEILTLSTF